MAFCSQLVVDSCSEAWMKAHQSAEQLKRFRRYCITEDFTSRTCTSPLDAMTAYDLQGSRLQCKNSWNFFPRGCVLRVRDLLVAANDPMIHNAINFVQLLCYLTCKQDGRVIVVTGLKLSLDLQLRGWKIFHPHTTYQDLGLELWR